MKAKTFENLIRKVVREEIDYALRREIKTLREDIREEIYRSSQIETIKDSPPQPVNTPLPKATKSSLREKIMGKSSFKPQNYTSNNSLNDLLNETAQGDTNTETAQAPGMPIESMPAPVQDVVNRDYSDLMKAIDKKKGK